MGALIYFLLFAGLFAIMMRFGCGAHVLGHRHVGAGHGDQTRLAQPEKDKDPVCGMTVETATAKTAAHAGHVYYFCSSACRDKFEASPETYLGKSTNTRMGNEDRHAP